MKIINFDERPSLVSQYMSEMRDVNVQTDPLRFRNNLERVGEIMAYEISQTMQFRDVTVRTPLAEAECKILRQQPVLATIFRAGVPFHQGFLNFFDRADNAFVSAFRNYTDGDNFEVEIEYLASPRLDGRTLVLCDPMLATGSSMELAWHALRTKGEPAHIHICAVIASRAAIDFVKSRFPDDRTTVWVGVIDNDLNAHSYIVPGLGDAGDLAYGNKE